MTASTRDAFLLVTHGSRDPRPAQAAAQLAQALAQRAKAQGSSRLSTNLSTGQPLIETAALEFADCPLHEQILRVGDRLLPATRLHIVPLFLLAGVHVTDDVPREVGLAQRQIDPGITLQLTPHLGRSPLMSGTLAQLFQAGEGGPTAAPAARILLSHGSRRAGSTQDAVALANQLGASLAYWSTAPQLSAQVADFVRAGQRRVTVLPYFLFPGGITDAIAQQVRQLRDTFDVEIITAPILSESARFEDLVAGLIGLRAVSVR